MEDEDSCRGEFNEIEMLKISRLKITRDIFKLFYLNFGWNKYFLFVLFLFTVIILATAVVNEISKELDFVRDQITTTEVNIANVYNYGVQLKKAAAAAKAK